MEQFGRALHYYADLLLAVASGHPIKGLDRVQLRRLALSSDPIKNLRRVQIPETLKNAKSNQAIKREECRSPAAGRPLTS